MNTPKQRSALFTVLSIFLVAIVGMACMGLIGLALFGFFQGITFIDGFASGALLLVFCLVVWKARLSWDKPIPVAVLIVYFAFLGMFLDMRGNPLYNLPLEWVFAPAGAVLRAHELVSHAAGTTAVNYEFRFIDAHGEVVRELSGWIVSPFRFVEYLAVLSLVMWPATWLRRRYGGSQWLPPEAP